MAKPRPHPRNAARAWQIRNLHPDLRVSPKSLRLFWRAMGVLPGAHPPDGDISLALMTDGELAEIHAKFLDDPTPTDVITFPGTDDGELAGEICVSAERAAIESAKRKRPFAHELTLYIVHGWLHLAGMDDLTAPGRRAMRRGEKIAMRHLQNHRAIPDFRLVGK